MELIYGLIKQPVLFDWWEEVPYLFFDCDPSELEDPMGWEINEIRQSRA